MRGDSAPCLCAATLYSLHLHTNTIILFYCQFLYTYVYCFICDACVCVNFDLSERIRLSRNRTLFVHLASRLTEKRGDQVPSSACSTFLVIRARRFCFHPRACSCVCISNSFSCTTRFSQLALVTCHQVYYKFSWFSLSREFLSGSIAFISLMIIFKPAQFFVLL